MKTTFALLLSMLIGSTDAWAAEPVITSLELKEANRTQNIIPEIKVNGLSYNQYWTNTFDALFDFADVNADDLLTESELPLVPSARAVRLSLGSAFTPPVAPLKSIQEITGAASETCSKAQLHEYYWRNGAGRLQVGVGRLPNTGALTAALLKALDADQNGQLSQTEIERAESTLKRLDTNDDELIGVGELVPHATYPGNWAAQALSIGTEIDLAPAGDGSLLLKRVAARPEEHQAKQNATWHITVAEQLSDMTMHVETAAHCESWSIPGPLRELHTLLGETIASADPNPPQASKEQTSRRDRQPDWSWLTPLADRDGNGSLSPAEIDGWLTLQKQLIQGQLLISVYAGGGLFELLDANHDAGLSVRELRNIWQTLQAANCTSGNQVDLNRVPPVILFVVSQGYPETLANHTMCEIEWFHLMDRNRDGDVSRREFTGSPAAFDRLDQDHDGLISPDEASRTK